MSELLTEQMKLRIYELLSSPDRETRMQGCSLLMSLEEEGLLSFLTGVFRELKVATKDAAFQKQQLEAVELRHEAAAIESSMKQSITDYSAQIKRLRGMRR